MEHKQTDADNEIDEIEELDGTALLSQDSFSETDINLLVDDVKGETAERQGRFRFISNLAEGGMGQISLARDMVFNRIVAVKTLHEKYRNSPGAKKAFLEECRLNAQLDHPSIVPVYSMDKTGDGHWEVVMKMINGSSLSSFFKLARKAYKGKTISSRKEHHSLLARLEYFLKICEVIDYCHSRKIVHGDLKPGNIMVGQYGEVYVMDWGCARKIGTIPEHFCGTPRYMPPEFIRDKVVTVLVDIYSLGKILYEFVTLERGEKEGEDSNSGNKSSTAVKMPAQWYYPGGGKVDAELKAVILKAIEQEPEMRYQSVKSLSRDVRRFIYGEEVSVAPFSPMRKVFRAINHHKIKSIVLTCLLFLALILASVLSYYHNQAKRVEFEFERNRNLTLRLRFQSFTDELAAKVEQNFLTAQAQLLLLADNIREVICSGNSVEGKFFNNDDYLRPETSPVGMQGHPVYAHPVNFNHVVRFPAERDNGIRQKLLNCKQYIHICRKVLRMDLNSYGINGADDIQSILFGGKSLPDRIFVRWANGERYVYPGTYEDPNHAAYFERRKVPGNIRETKSLLWSQPFENQNGAYRMICRHPLYDDGGSYLGCAGLELRMENVLEPLMEASRMTNGHKFYFIDIPGHKVVMIDKGRVVHPDEDGFFSDKIHSVEILKAADRLRETNAQQYEDRLGGREYFISGAMFEVSETMFIQMIGSGDMHAHFPDNFHSLIKENRELCPDQDH